MSQRSCSDLEKLIVLEQNVEGLEKTLEYLQECLQEAYKKEEERTQKIKQQEERIKELERLLSEEKEKNNCFREILEGEVNPTESLLNSTRLQDPKETFGTVSTALMQYKYDELQQSNQRCLQAYCRKEKQLKEMTNENVELSKEIHGLKYKQKELYLKIQELCYRYLNYKTKKDNEIFELHVNLENAIQIIKELKMSEVKEYSR